MRTDIPDNYYVSQKEKLTKQLVKVISRVKSELVTCYGKAGAEEIQRQILVEFERLLPEIPYVGGRKNKLTIFIIQSAWALAFYRALQQHGGSVEDAGKLLQQAAESMFKATPQFLRHIYGKIMLSKFRYPSMLAAAQKTQEREFPGNWVQEFVAGDGESFDFGINYTECGIVKFMEAQNATELTGYLCQTDFAALESLGLKLNRTETIASGCERCNFRISKK